MLQSFNRGDNFLMVIPLYKVNYCRYHFISYDVKNSNICDSLLYSNLLM